MNTSAGIQALDHTRADRTLLATGFQTYQLGGQRGALIALAPLAAKLKSDLDRVYALTASEPSQQHRLDQIDSQLSGFDRLYGELPKLD